MSSHGAEGRVMMSCQAQNAGFSGANMQLPGRAGAALRGANGVDLNDNLKGSRNGFINAPNTAKIRS